MGLRTSMGRAGVASNVMDARAGRGWGASLEEMIGHPGPVESRPRHLRPARSRAVRVTDVVLDLDQSADDVIRVIRMLLVGLLRAGGFQHLVRKLAYNVTMCTEEVPRGTPHRGCRVGCVASLSA